MTRRTIATYTAVAAFALASGPALWAQDRPNPGQSSGSSAGARPNPGGGSSGSAVSRPSGGSSSGSSTSSPSGGSSGGSSSGGFSSGGDSGGYRPARPERRPEGSRAVPRSGASANGGEQRRVSPGGAAAASAGDNADPRRRAVPTYARPRDGRTVTGSAVDRRLLPTRPGDVYIDPFVRYSYYYNRYPYGYYWPGYGFGMGYFYDPYLWGYGPSSYYDPYYYGGYGGGGGYVRYREGQYRPVGSLRLKVQPREAQVYVDGYFVGEVDSFDGVFQKLTIEEGAHRVEIRAPGFETAQFEVMVLAGQTVTYKGDMKRIQ